MLPFFIFVALFLLLPTVFVLLGAFQTPEGAFTSENIRAVLTQPRYVQAFLRSIQLSVATALVGALLGALLAWAVSSGGPGGWLRQLVVAASGVLAQFGGVMLAFGFLAAFGFNGLVTMALADTARASNLTPTARGSTA